MPHRESRREAARLSPLLRTKKIERWVHGTPELYGPYTMQKDHTSVTKQDLTWNPQGKRKRGQPRNSWKRDTEIEMKKLDMSWTGIKRKVMCIGILW